MSCSAQSIQDYRNYLIKYEGYKNKPYYCQGGQLTVGIGHFLSRKDNIKIYYTNKEIDKFFEKDINETIKINKKIYNNFNQLPNNIKLILVSLTFNIGGTKIQTFIKFNKAINNHDWKIAAKELRNSLYYHQLPQRANDYINILNAQ